MRPMSTLPIMRWFLALAWLGPALSAVPARADDDLRFRGLPPAETRVPRTLLKVARSIEGQKEMGVEGANTVWMDGLLRELDAEWASERPTTEADQHRVMAGLEARLADAIGPRLGDGALRRLRQLELQAQEGRAMLRGEVAEFLALDSGQRRKVEALIAQTDRLADQAAATAKAGSPDAALFTAWQRYRAGENVSVRRILNGGQSTRWQAALGRKMDTARFQRIHPTAPEFPSGAVWLDGKATTMASLRGKVVLVHFYAFQCHNCQANFRTYNRWQKSLRDQGVEMVGIQTPETAAERDVARVTEAAHQCEFGFPVMLDLDSEAWRAWGNTVWPTIYIVDQRGYIRSWWVGELYWQGARGDQSVENWVRRLLAEAKSMP